MRTYAMDALRVFVLRIAQAPQAGRFLASLVAGAPDTIALTTAVPWPQKPDYCVNVGFTHDGLAALGVTQASLDTFPEDFRQGAVARAGRVGDTGASAPANWRGGLATSDVHVLVFLFAQTAATRDQLSTRLRAAFAAGFTEVSTHDAGSLPGNVAHFGYRDGFAQPTIDGGLPPLLPDVLPKAPAGEFLFGHPSQYADFSYPVPQPAAQLGHNGSFVAFRILAQDCHGFEQFLVDASRQTSLDPELVAAKLCGRWRNGMPLALSPERPDGPVPIEKFNSFDYVPTESTPDAVDDRRGYRCPIGSHIRRMNPRNSTVAGNSGLKRRIVRRGLPYGPRYDPGNTADGIERGLLGLFIGVSLKDQFEFLMSDWANKGAFAPGLKDTRDPILGDHAAPGTFLLPVEGRKPIEVTGMSRFVTCRGAAYCFLPSATGVRYLATVAGN